MNTKLKLAFATAIATTLTACGGGGTTAATTPPVVTPPVTNPVTPANLQLTVPTPTYAAGSVELQAFNRLNELRQKYGFGLVKQNVALDVSTKAHLDYSVANNIFGHSENASLQSYYAAWPYDRALKAGYGSNQVSEVMGSGVLGVSAVDGLQNTILHRSVMFSQSVTDVGIAGYVYGSFSPTIIDLGSKTEQNNASNFVTTIPANQESGVPLNMAPEMPSPYPDIAIEQLEANTTSPVSVFVAAGKTLAVTKFTVTERGQSSALDLRLLTSSNDTNYILKANEAHVTGKKPFKPNTTYDVVFEGTADGVAISKNWSFVTALR